jgi:hypothetical protein
MKLAPYLLAFASLATAACATGDTSPDAGSIGADASAPDAPVDAAPGAPDAALFDAPPGTPDGSPDAPPPPDADVGPTIVFTGSNPTTQVGNVNGGSPFDDACPAGQALIGFYGNLTSETGHHGQLGGRCGAVSPVDNGGSYGVTVTPSAVLDLHGVLGTFNWTRTCPADQVIVGFGGRSGQLIDQLIFRCAPISVTPELAVTIGTITELAAAGGSGGNPFTTVDCTAGQVGTMARIRAGDSIDAFGIACSSVTAQ